LTTEKKRKFIINFIYLLILIVIIYFIFKYAINTLMPFFIAYIVASMLRPLVEVLCRRIKINKKIISFIIVLIFYALVAVIMVLLAARVISIAKTQVERLPALYRDNIQPALVELFDSLSKLPDDIDPSIAEVLSSITDNLISFAGKLFTKISDVIVGAISGLAYSIPKLVVSTVFCIIASYYIIIDRGLIGDFIRRQLPENVNNTIKEASIAIRDIVWDYIRSYAQILGITFVELVIAMLILRVANPVFVALFIAVFDILPVVGTGTILIPWLIIEFINKDYKMAIGLTISYAVIFVVRNVIEPKIIGEQVGLHPLVTIIAMFVGTVFFGVVGLFGLPITLALLKDLNEKGVIKIFK
jgi:sporulation integral membrane protein YtvI